MKKTDLKEFSTQDLQAKLAELEQNLVKMKINHSISPLDNPMQIKAARKEIARIHTELRWRELNN